MVLLENDEVIDDGVVLQIIRTHTHTAHMCTFISTGSIIICTYIHVFNAVFTPFGGSIPLAQFIARLKTLASGARKDASFTVTLKRCECVLHLNKNSDATNTN